MKTQININCPNCHSSSLKKNGIKSYGKQNYQGDCRPRLGKRDFRKTKKLRARLKKLKVRYGSISMDHWDSFKTAFKADSKQISERYIVGIEGSNCRLRHRLTRDFRKTCTFSKKLDNHLKTFNLVFFYINCGYV